jgi:polar amino acid transport system substrate-binding protein
LGRLDLVIEIDLVGQEIIHHLFPDASSSFGSSVILRSVSPITILLDEEQPQAQIIANKYREGLARIIENGTYLEILKRYYGANQVPADWRKQLEKFGYLYGSGGLE